LSVLQRNETVLLTRPDVHAQADVFDPKASGAAYDDVILRNSLPSLPVAFPDGHQQHLQVRRRLELLSFCRWQVGQQGVSIKAVVHRRIALAPEEMWYARKVLGRKPKRPQLQGEPFPLARRVAVLSTSEQSAIAKADSPAAGPARSSAAHL
jgi:hypothetical protein